MKPRWTHGRLLAASLTLSTLLLTSQAWSQPRVAIRGPTQMVGDGLRRARLKVTIKSRGNVSKKRIVLRASAGTLGEVHQVGKRDFEVDYVAPRVAEPLTVVIGPRGKALAAAPLEIQLAPPSGIGRPRRTGGKLALTVPGFLVLGRAESATISVANGRASVWVSVGRLLQPTRSAKSTEVAFEPPATLHPQVAIVVASSDDGKLIEWTPVMLHGRPYVKTVGEPRAAVRATVAGVEFGPVLADRKGEVRMRVEAPAGTRQAEVLSLGRRGVPVETMLPISAPAAGHLYAVCHPNERALHVFAVDDSGSPRPGLKLSAEVQAGQLGSWREVEPGMYTARYRAPARTKEATTVEATVSAEGMAGGGTRCQWQMAALEQVASLAITAESTRLTADGTSSTSLRVVAKSATGKPVGGARLTAQAMGSVGPFTESAPGVFVASYTAPQLARSAVDTVVVRDELSGRNAQIDVSVEAEVLEPKRRFRVALRGGLVSNFGLIVAPAVAAGFDVRLPLADENLTAGVDLGIYAGSFNERDDADIEDVEIHLTAVPIRARLGYELDLQPVRPYFGLEAGVLMAHTTVSSPTTGTTSETLPGFVGGGLVGADTQLGPGRIALEAAFHYAPASHEDVSGNLSGLALTAGYRYGFY